MRDSRRPWKWDLRLRERIYDDYDLYVKLLKFVNQTGLFDLSILPCTCRVRAIVIVLV